MSCKWLQDCIRIRFQEAHIKIMYLQQNFNFIVAEMKSVNYYIVSKINISKAKPLFVIIVVK